MPDLDATLRALRRRRRGTPFGLTSRELEIIKEVVGGSTNREIAETFSISENTVKRHLSHIFNKLGASNRVELALFASHHRLIETTSVSSVVR
jgi:DNA-binding NarL/FixJ family response regulator